MIIRLSPVGSVRSALGRVQRSSNPVWTVFGKLTDAHHPEQVTISLVKSARDRLKVGMLRRIGSIVATFAVLALPAAACSCVGGGIRSCPVPTADMIVVATVISKELVHNAAAPGLQYPNPSPANRATRSPTLLPQPEPWGSVKVTLSVSERFRGNSGNSLVIRTESGTEACGYPFEVGQGLLVFANEFRGNLTETTCSATQPANMAVSTILQLRTLRDGTALPGIFGSALTHPAAWSQTGWEQVQPVRGLTVTARAERGEYRTRTADDGSYEFRGLPIGPYQLSVEPPAGRLVLWDGGADHVGVGVGYACPVNFEVYYDGRISGTVIGPDGQPRSGSITAWYADPEKLNAAPVESHVQNGQFEIARLWPGRYRLVFQTSADGRSSTLAIYYPGTQVESEAALIELGAGTHVDGLRFTIF